jgi:hypothetical protein
MSTRIAVSERVAAYSLFSSGFTVEQVQAFINSQRGICSDGYIYADQIPTELED